MNIMDHFQYGHLPYDLQVISAPVCDIAKELDRCLEDSPEKSAGLRKLLEAKDCMVRAAIETGYNVDVTESVEESSKEEQVEVTADLSITRDKLLKVKELSQSEVKYSYRQIATIVGLSQSAVGRAVKGNYDIQYDLNN